MENEWKIIEREHKNGESYNGNFEITNGNISIISNNYNDLLQPIVDFLNNSCTIIYIDDSETLILKERIKLLEFMIENGLGYQDMVNDNYLNPNN